MAGNSGDLQQWLENLKKKAEEQKRGGSPRQPEAQPAPRPRPTPRAEPPVAHHGASSRDEMRRIRLNENREREVVQRREVEQEELARQAKAKADQARKLKAKAEQKRAKVEAAKKRIAARRRMSPQEMPASDRRGARRPAQYAPARSSLGLSGNLIHDLRQNPRALREAVLLVEILGPPLADRDPMDRFI